MIRTVKKKEGQKECKNTSIAHAPDAPDAPNHTCTKDDVGANMRKLSINKINAKQIIASVNAPDPYAIASGVSMG